MVLRARVVRLKGRNRQFIGMNAASLPQPTRLEIHDEDDGVFLFRFNDAGEFGGDTWHETIESVKRQADEE